MTEFRYHIIDKSGKCLEFYEAKGPDDVWARIVIGNIKGRRSFGQGDAMVARDELIDAGLEWGQGFYLKKELPDGT